MTTASEVCQNSSGQATAGNPCHLSQEDVDTGLGDWKALLNFRPPASVSQAVLNRWGSLTRNATPSLPGNEYESKWPYHAIELGRGDVNLDFYPVDILKLPRTPLSFMIPSDPSTPAMTVDELYAYLRASLTNFVDPDKAVFMPYDDPDVEPWKSTSPVGAVLSIKLSAFSNLGVSLDRGSVVCTDFASDHWIFSTLWTPRDGSHPVSGNRQFGIGLRKPADVFSKRYNGIFEGGAAITQDTNYFYTRGADRCTSLMYSMMSGKVFAGGHECWLSLQRNFHAFVERHGGQARIPGCVSDRWGWDKEIQTLWTRPPM